MNLARRAAALCVSSALTACSFAPRYTVPASAPAGAQFQGAGDWKPAQPADAAPRGDWWTMFQDPQLDSLEGRIGGANQDIRAALARYRQARAQTRIARADFLPSIDVSAGATRARTSSNSPRFPPGEAPVFNNFALDADLSYEFDLWGRIRNSVSGARAAESASAGDLAAVDLAIRAELAMDYFALRSEDAQQLLLDKTVEDYEKSLNLAQNLYAGGAAALTDVAQAQAQLETARTRAADIRLQRAQSEHAVAVLLGENPSAFHLAANPLRTTTAPPPVDPGLPSALLERRPDIAAAERRVAAANAGIGVARAAYFPVFSLAASLGFDSASSSTWLNAPSRTWSVGPAAVLTVFDTGRHRAQTAQARAVYDEQVADYRRAVLTAYQEVEDSLAALGQLQQESSSVTAAVAATASALQQANYRYKAGLVTYLEVASTENTALQAELSASQIQLRRMNAVVLLIKALGGGWRDAGSAPAQGALPAQ